MNFQNKNITSVLLQLRLQPLSSTRSFTVIKKNQCCQLLANDFGHINRKIGPLAKMFGRTHYLFKEDALQRLLPQKKLHAYVDWTVDLSEKHTSTQSIFRPVGNTENFRHFVFCFVFKCTFKLGCFTIVRIIIIIGGHKFVLSFHRFRFKMIV
jgi:hypothetical protein